jgi:hypothetical protein
MASGKRPNDSEVLPNRAPPQLALRPPRTRARALVSGRYHYNNSVGSFPGAPPVLLIWVRVDVDSFFPQKKISITVREDTSSKTFTAIADVKSDQRFGGGHRRIKAEVVTRDTSSNLPGAASLNLGSSYLLDVVFPRFESLVFEVSPGWSSKTYTFTLEGTAVESRSYPLTLQSRRFDSVDIEVARVQGAGPAVTSYDISTHPNRPSDLPLETLSLETVYERAGFDVTLSPTYEIPLAEAGEGPEATWSDSELHSAMVAYWSRWADKPQWALWLLFAARYDDPTYWGMMFDKIGAFQRQGAAVFTTHIAEIAPADSTRAAWIQRLTLFAAVHEVGHAFNLEHAFQSISAENRTFMNYPDNPKGGQEAFFSDFRFRFLDQELVFLRHEPRHRVQMANAPFKGASGSGAAPRPGKWALTMKASREANAYSFLEPVAMELKLTSNSARALHVDAQVIAQRITVWVQRSGGAPRRWRPMVTALYDARQTTCLKRGESLHGSHLISAAAEGWLIDEPGIYSVRAAVDVAGEIVFSNVVTLHVAPPGHAEEIKLAPDYFTEAVARCLVFDGAPALPTAMNTLEEVVARRAESPAALHAAKALAMPRLRAYKLLEIGDERSDMVIRHAKPELAAATKKLTAALMNEPDRATETLGHIAYFGALHKLATALTDAGNTVAAKRVHQCIVATTKRRNTYR